MAKKDVTTLPRVDSAVRMPRACHKPAVPLFDSEAIDDLGRLLAHIRGLAGIGALIEDDEDGDEFPLEDMRELLWSIQDFAREAMIATNMLEQQYREALDEAEALHG